MSENKFSQHNGFVCANAGGANRWQHRYQSNPGSDAKTQTLQHRPSTYPTTAGANTQPGATDAQASQQFQKTPHTPSEISAPRDVTRPNAPAPNPRRARQIPTPAQLPDHNATPAPIAPTQSAASDTQKQRRSTCSVSFCALDALQRIFTPQQQSTSSGHRKTLIAHSGCGMCCADWFSFSSAVRALIC